jgi:hypothetical protein
MSEDRYAKYGAATGIVFVVLVVVGFLIVTPSPPDLDAPVDEWSSYFTDHQDAINTGVVLISVSLFFFIWFLGSLTSALRIAAGSPRLPSIAFGGGLVFAASLFIALTSVAIAAHRPDEVSPELTRALNDGGILAGVPGIAGLLALFGATALVILRGDLLPHWLGWLSGVAAVVQLLTFGVLYTDTGAFAADGVLGLFVPFTVGILTVLALSIVLIQTAEELNRSVGLTDRVRGAVTGAAAGAQAGAAGRPPRPPTT